ncbi:MAG: pyrroline-5-carboxylate reductase [Acetivibrionales bacterium]
MEKKIGFIGTGNMGSALLKGLVESGMLLPSHIYIYDIDTKKTETLSNETGVIVARDNEELVCKSDIIVLAVKPNMAVPVLERVKGVFDNKKILVSIAVGIAINTLKGVLGEDKKIIRTMPNTPALVKEGMTLISYGENVNDNDAAIVKNMFECVGKVEILDESLMNEVTALTSSSPAYVFMFIEAMGDAAVLSGIPRNLAYKLASQAVLGSAKLVLETGKHPGQLKDQVCSPAGTTIEAVYALEKNGFRHSVIEAMNGCTRRAREIGGNGQV